MEKIMGNILRPSFWAAYCYPILESVKVMSTHKSIREATECIFQYLQGTDLPLFNIFNESTKRLFQ